MKVIFITNIPAHYRVAMLNKADEILRKNDIEMTVVFVRQTYKRRDYWSADKNNFKFRYIFLNNKYSISIGRKKLLESGLGIRKILAEIKPDLIVSGGFSLLSLNVSIFSRKHGIKYALYSGETESTSKKLLFKRLRYHLRNYIIKNAHYFIVYGKKAEEYIENFGIKKNRISVAINSIDTNRFIQKLGSVEKKANKNVNLLFVGELRESKGLIHLLKALDIIEEKGFELRIVGDGAYRKYLNKYIADNKISFVKFEGKISHDEMQNYYRQSDVFILPSIFEHFGLVLVEAACAGLPLIATTLTGGAFDVIEEGINGYIVDPFDHGGFSEKIGRLISDKELRIRMGKASLRIIENKVNINLSGLGFANGIIKCLNEEN